MMSTKREKLPAVKVTELAASTLRRSPRTQPMVIYMLAFLHCSSRFPTWFLWSLSGSSDSLFCGFGLASGDLGGG